MKERVSVLKPSFKKAILLIAPHGKDDLLTGELTQKLSENLNCCALINWGFEKSLTVDSLNDKADCNKISHCVSEVVLDEYYLNLVKIIGKLNQIHETIHIFHIHGCKNLKNNIHVVGGFGSEQNPSCENWRRYAFSSIYQKELKHFMSFNYSAYAIAKENGKYSGQHMDNMNQLFSHRIEETSSIQLEFTPTARNLYYSMAVDVLIKVIEEYTSIKFDNYTDKDVWSENPKEFNFI